MSIELHAKMPTEEIPFIQPSRSRAGSESGMVQTCVQYVQDFLNRLSIHVKTPPHGSVLPEHTCPPPPRPFTKPVFCWTHATHDPVLSSPDENKIE